jgi:hypothetical protein
MAPPPGIRIGLAVREGRPLRRRQVRRNHEHPGHDSKFIGELIRPDDPGYDEARRLFNGRID